MPTPDKARPLDAAGPPLEQLTQRLQETPAEFLDAPAAPDSDGVSTAALVHDLLLGMGVRADRKLLEGFRLSRPHGANTLRLVQVCCWLLADPWFADSKRGPQVPELLHDTLPELAGTESPARFVEDAERREELARSVLAALGLRPAGETEKQARDRLSRISAVERRRLIAASRTMEERARAIRAALAEQAARESADKWTRE